MMRAIFTHLIGPQKGQRIKFDAAKISVGRAADNMLCLGEAARRVSAHHAEVIRRGDQYVLRDLGSTNGTMINGRRVMVSELERDDLVEFGAGGPLLRFDANPDGREAFGEGPADRASSVHGKTGGPHVSSTRGNLGLITALVVAMLLGGILGILASSRLRVSDPETFSFVEIAQLTSPAVVFIRTEFELVDSTGRVTLTEARTGSGFVVSTSGLIVTNRHLVRDWEYNTPPFGITGRLTKIEVILPHDTRNNALPAEIHKLGPDSSVDIAVLRIKSHTQSSVHGVEADIGRINQGDEVVVIGYPLGLDLLQMTNDSTVEPSLSTGIVSRVGHDFIQLTLRAYQGGSGGPVVNRRGEVIAILTAKVGSAQDIALCTPVSAALELLNNDAEFKPKQD